MSTVGDDNAAADHNSGYVRGCCGQPRLIELCARGSRRRRAYAYVVTKGLEQLEKNKEDQMVEFQEDLEDSFERDPMQE